MQIEKTDHKSGLGIYAKSIKIETKEQWEDAKKIAGEMVEWINKENGNFKGEFSKAYAVAHCQVAPIKSPYQMFVVSESLVVPEKHDKEDKQQLSNAYFEAQAIFNVEILETPEKIIRTLPERKLKRDEDNKMQVQVEVVMVDKLVKNMIEVPEGCMSFPHRKQKNKERFYEIKVRYNYLDKKGKVKEFEGTVSSLKAHILQHEYDHFIGKNIFFD